MTGSYARSRRARQIAWSVVMALLVALLGVMAGGGIASAEEEATCSDNKAPGDPNSIAQDGGVLTIVGDDEANVVKVRNFYEPGQGGVSSYNIKVWTDFSNYLVGDFPSGTVTTTTNGEPPHVYLYFEGVEKVVVTTCMGDDMVDMEGTTNLVGPNKIDTGSGEDNVKGSPVRDVIRAGADDDTIEAGDGDDNVDGGLGNEFIDGDEGNDVLQGDKGDDTIYGGLGNDRINGEAGNDMIDGEEDDDKMYGSSGDDRLSDIFGDNLFNCGSGEDVAVPLLGADGNRFKKCETIDPFDFD